MEESFMEESILEQLDLITFNYQRILTWVNDNIGNGDGTQFIREIWRSDPKLAEHFASKWKQYVRNCAAAIESDTQSGWPVQQLALQQFLMNLSHENLRLFVEYAINNV